MLCRTTSLAGAVTAPPSGAAIKEALTHHDAAAPPFWRSRYAVGLLVTGAVAAYLLLSEHRAHFLGALPLLLLLSCPLMHVFMHHGHGDQAHQHGDAPGTPSTPVTEPRS